MQIQNSFIIPVPVAEAWPILLDLRRIAPCLPGATIDDFNGDEYAGRVKVKLGPIQLTYAGTARFIERDEATHRAVIEGAGKDTRGASTAKALITTTLVDCGDETEVAVITDLNITGKPAQFGRGVMQDVSSKLLEQFVGNLSTQLASERASTDVMPAGATTANGAPPDEPAGQPPASESHRRLAVADTDAIDLMDAAGAAVAKRLIPVALSVIAVVALLVWLL
jgi:carbon monoxide dehydrogenase subunit G